MGRGVPVQPLEPLADIEQLRHERLGVARLLETGLAGNGLREGDGVRRIVRHELAQPVDLAIGHLQHAADVAQHRARLELAEGDDMGHAVGAVALAHIGDHLVAAVLTEIDVEVRHRHALGVEEALEEQPEAHGIEVGDGERPGDERAGARAAARPDRNSPRLRPLDEIGDDEEVALIVHAGDDIELEGKAIGISGCVKAGRGALLLKSPGKTRLRLAAKFGRFRLALRLRASRARQELRQDRRMLPRTIRAAARDLDGVLDRLRQIGEQRGHLPRALEIMLGTEATPRVHRDIASLGDADERVVRLEIVGAAEIGLVGGDDRQMIVVSKIEQKRFDRPLLRQTVALKLDIETVAENAFQLVEGGFGKPEIVGGDGAVDHAVRAAGQRDEPLLVESQMSDRDHRLAAVGAVSIGLGGKLDEIGVAARILGE